MLNTILSIVDLPVTPESYSFADLPDECQKLIAEVSLTRAAIERHFGDAIPMMIDQFSAAAENSAELVAIMCRVAIDKWREAESERDALRSELEKIGRKSFWAARGAGR